MVEIATVASALLLIAAFVLAFKVLKTAVEAAIVAGISAAFYAAMAATLGFPLSIDAVIRFAALGTVLYVVYSTLFPLLGVAWSAVKTPFDAASWVRRKMKAAREKKRLKRIESMVDDHEEKLEDDEGGKETKEVVLDKVAGEEDEG